MRERNNHLANRVTTFILIGAMAFYITIGISLNAVRHQSNESADIDTTKFVKERFASLQNHVRQLARDYNNWSDAYFAAKTGDLNFLADNYGITALNGDMFDGAILFDGPFIEPIAWRSGGERLPKPSFLSGTDLENIRLQVSKLRFGDRQTFDFVIMQEGVLEFASASRILPDTPEALANIDFSTAPIGVIFRIPRQAELEAIFSSLKLRQLAVSAKSNDNNRSLALLGPDGSPAAYILWLPPLTGDQLIAKTRPVVVFIFLMSALMIALGVHFLRKSAKELTIREAEAFSLARTDVLTSMPNRLALSEYLANFDSIRKDRESPPNNGLAIVLFDLDGFKNVNDLVGHGGGDHVIVEIARRLGKLASSNIFFARVGGDEFVAVIHGRNLEASVERVSKLLLKLIGRQIIYNGARFEVSCSCGVAIRSSNDEFADDLLQFADRAMYQSKKRSGSFITYYDAEMDDANESDRRIERSLRSALLEPSEFSIFYQPIIDSGSGALVRVEALARWISPHLGAVGPDLFIPIAERGGMMCTLGDLIFKNVAADMLRHRDIHVSVNVSPLQLMSPGFVERVKELFLREEIDPRRVELELTEGIAVQNLDGVSGQLGELRALGFSTALDDFGTGFSSLGYLSQMPFDTLKIDRSFVSGLIKCRNMNEFVSSIISLGHALGKKVTAEGVESERVAEWLSRAGCDCLQGYYFGLPQPMDDILRQFSGARASENEVLV